MRFALSRWLSQVDENPPVNFTPERDASTRAHLGFCTLMRILGPQRCFPKSILLVTRGAAGALVLTWLRFPCYVGQGCSCHLRRVCFQWHCPLSTVVGVAVGWLFPTLGPAGALGAAPGPRGEPARRGEQSPSCFP